MKDFDTWNKIKKKIQKNTSQKLFKEGEIWLTHLGSNIGIEQDGKGYNFVRPVLILRKYNPQHCLALPLTTKKQPSHVSFHLCGKTPFLKKESWIIFSQARVLDVKRFHRKMGKLSEYVFQLIQKKSARTIVRASGTLSGK